MIPRTLSEAAQFLRMSKSNLYQRKDIPRYRLAGSRTLLFDQNELETLLKQSKISAGEPAIETPTLSESSSPTENGAGIVDISSQRVYHRNARYR